MANKQQKKQMLDFLVSKLEDENRKVLPQSITLHGNKIDYILTEEGLILLVNKKFGDDNFNKVLNAIRNEFKNSGIVFYKDGKTFFRNAQEKYDFKRKYSLSLKNYNSEQMNRMIILTPEEIIANNQKNLVQYYQPNSERLEEMLVTYKYNPVNFDYSHINSHEQFKPDDKSSKRLYIWNDKHETNKPLKLESNILKPL